MAFPTTLPSYTITAGAETLNTAAGGTGLSGLLNAFEVDITALGTKIGTGASTPTSATVLRGNGIGTSVWGQIVLGTDIAAFSSATLAGLVSDETGSGSLVFGTSPTISAPVLSGTTTGTYTLGGTPTITSPTINQFATGSGIGAAWTSFTPSFTNLTVGNGTNVGNFMQIGKLVYVRTSLTLGTTSSVGSGPALTLPVNSASMAPTLSMWLGWAYLQGSLGVVRWNSTTLVDFTVINTAGTFGAQNGVSATIPVTWATGNIITLYFSYEAA